MLYWLHDAFGINLFFYISVRAGVAFTLAFALTLFLMPKFIRWAKKRKATQPIYELAPDGHREKHNTPTMGGVVFLVSIFTASLISGDLENGYMLTGLLVLILFGAIGIRDDLGKIFGKANNKGLSSRGKLFWQFLSAFVIGFVLMFQPNMLSELYIPFLKFPLFDMGLWALPFWAIVIVGASNAVNLTDGLDGLATVPSIFAFVTLGVLMYITGHAIFSGALLMPKIIGVGEVTILAAAIIGGLLGFLWFNANPAEVFMGDSGSLTIGALIGYMGVVSKSEFLLLLIGFIFVIETLSVIVQIASFRIRGQRIFLMAPLHHHFELKQWAENKIIVRFWVTALLSNILALITIKIR